MPDPDDLDAARIGIQLDLAEEAGLIETDVAETLRGLVREKVAWNQALWDMRSRISRNIHRMFENAYQIPGPLLGQPPPQTPTAPPS